MRLADSNPSKRLDADALLAENDRLRAALTEIATGEPPDEVWSLNVASSGVEWAGKIAREALAKCA